jgi:phosphopantetheine adenylyltransferase
MKDNKNEFVIEKEIYLIGFPSEQFYRIIFKDTKTKICNVYIDEEGVLRVDYANHTEIEVLIRALKYAQKEVKS